MKMLYSSYLSFMQIVWNGLFTGGTYVIHLIKTPFTEGIDPGSLVEADFDGYGPQTVGSFLNTLIPGTQIAGVQPMNLSGGGSFTAGANLTGPQTIYGAILKAADDTVSFNIQFPNPQNITMPGQTLTLNLQEFNAQIDPTAPGSVTAPVQP